MGSIGLTYDLYGNHWCLGPRQPSGLRPLLLLSADAPSAWRAEDVASVPVADWRWVIADEYGYLWITARERLLCLDPRAPKRGCEDVSAALTLNTNPITAAGTSVHGKLLTAQSDGTIAEIQFEKTLHVRRRLGPTALDSIGADGDGNLWATRGDRTWILPAPANAWQRHWELIARLPGSNHDLAGDTLNGSFYLAGGRTAMWGYPSRNHVYAHVIALPHATGQWQTVATLQQPSFYSAVAGFQQSVWVIGGQAFQSSATAAQPLVRTEILDPFSGQMKFGPPLPQPVAMPAAASIDGRLYVAGDVMTSNGTAPVLWSIGAGETSWRSGPAPGFCFGALVSCADSRFLYIAVPKRGLVAYDTRTSTWLNLADSDVPRSPQIAMHHGELWQCGGRELSTPTLTRIYNPKDGLWRTGPDMPWELAWGAAGDLAGSLILAGGADGKRYSNATLRLRD